MASKLRGLTLVEVVASLLIMGSAMAALLVGQSRSLRQIDEAEHQLTATLIARELIANWRLEGQDLMTAGSGEILNQPGWLWTRRGERRSMANDLFVSEVTLVIECRTEVLFAASRKWEYRWLIDEPRS
jgi:Tfp pilus assembly protein PilV